MNDEDDTEERWRTTTEGVRLICLVRGGSDRKLRLVACALCRTIWVPLSQSAKEAVEVAEEFADGHCDESTREKHFNRIGAAGGTDSRRIGKWLPRCAVSECGWYAAELGVGSGIESGTEVAIIRDIFGNPFPPRCARSRVAHF